jgi:hypothetical protein
MMTGFDTSSIQAIWLLGFGSELPSLAAGIKPPSGAPDWVFRSVASVAASLSRSA